jgi:hypothetical protein
MGSISNLFKFDVLELISIGSKESLLLGSRMICEESLFVSRSFELGDSVSLDLLSLLLLRVLGSGSDSSK